MNTPLPGIAAASHRFGLLPRILVIALVASAEILLGSYLVQAVPLDTLHGAPEALRLVQHWLFRFIIAYAVSLVLLASMRGTSIVTTIEVTDRVRPSWALVHVLLMLPFFYLSATLYSPAVPFIAMAIAWHLIALAAMVALFATFAPAATWLDVLRKTGGLPIFAIVPAAAAVGAIRLSQMLWEPAAEITFRFVNLLLEPVLPGLQSDPVTRILGSARFSVQIAEVCSGLEGIGLMIAFCAAWLWFFRREYRFPRALVVIPIGVAVAFVLNALRIAVLVLIGNAGYDRVAVVGFHSQAGWIAFNVAAFGVAILAHTNPWLSRAAAERRALRLRAAASGSSADTHLPAESNPTAAYLVPLLAILASGMIARSLSADFEIWYPLRLVAAATALWFYRRAYAGVNFGFSWRGPLIGVLVFAVWTACAAWLNPSGDEPAVLAALSPGEREAWIACRLIAAVVTVPLAEELAYRGYLLRRLATPQFESAPFSAARWPALALSAVAFGIVHGRFWIAGIIAGLAYGAIAMRTNKLGESVAAHATTNALIAAQVLLFRHWWLW